MLNFDIVGQGATTKIYRDGTTAIKLYMDASYGEVQGEAERQQFAYDNGLPVPAVYGVRRLDARSVALDMEYVDGRPLMQPGMGKDDRNSAVQTLVRLQCGVHRLHAGGLPFFAERLSLKISSLQELDEPIKHSLLLLLARLDRGFTSLCHGDFHPLNVLFDGRKHWIVDWVDAAAGDPLADACRTYIIFKQHLSRLAGMYLRVFCSETCARQEDILAWQPVIAAARLAENADAKSRAWLLSQVQAWHKSSRVP